MVDSTLYPQSKAFNEGLAAGGYSGGRSIFSQPEEPARLDQATVDTFTTIANKYGVPADVLLGLAEKDSGFNEFNRSRGPGSKVRGIINVTDEEVARGEYNPYDTAQNVEAAARKLRSYMQAGASVEEAVMAHAGGPDRSKWSPEVASYAQDVMARSARLSETYYPGMAPRVAETETKIDPKTGKPVELTTDEIRKIYGIDDPGRPGIGQQLGEDVQRGFANLGNIGRGLKGMAQAAVGDEAGAKATLDEYVKREYLNARENPAVIGSYKNIRNDWQNFFGDAGRYAIEAVGENAAMFLPAIATGGIGASIGRAITERATARFIEDQVAKGLTREAAEALAAKAVDRGITMGAAAGAAPSTMGMETGSIGGDIYKETGQIRPGVAAAGGAVAGALDLVEPVMAIKKAFGPAVSEPVKDMVIKAIVKRVGVEGAKQFAIEAGTEGLQTIVEQASTRAVDGKPLFTPELLDDVVDSALKGGIGGGVMGVGSQIIEEVRRRPPEEKVDTTTRDPSAINAAVVAPLRAQESLAASAGEPRDATAMGAAGRAPAAAGRVLSESADAARDPSTMRNPRLEASVAAAPEGVSPAASTEAIKEIAAEAPGRQTAADLRDIESAPKPATARPGGQGPLSRVLETGAPNVAPLATAAGQRVVLTDESGSIPGIVVGQDAEGILFKDDTGFEQLIENDLITSGKVSIAPADAAPPPAPAAPDPFALTPEQQRAEDEYYAGQTTAVATPITENSNLAATAAATIPTEPPPAPPTRSVSEMSEEELRARLKFIAGQGKANGWNPRLIEARKEVERAIDALAPKQAKTTSENPKTATETTTPPVAPKDKIISFSTAKGSTYQVHEDGTTTRNKAARNDPGHEGDSGLKKRSSRTIYVDSEAQATALSSAGVSNRPEGGMHVILRNGKAALIWQGKDGKWGAASSGRDIPFTDTPDVKKFPVELWNPSDLNGETIYGGQHAGNMINMVASEPAGQAERREKAQAAAPQAKEKPKAPPPEPLVDEEPAQPVTRATDAQIKRLLTDYSMNTPKAMQAKIDNYGLNDTHETYEMPDKGDGVKRFGVREKAAPQSEISPPAPQAVEIPAAPAPKTEGEISPKAEDATGKETLQVQEPVALPAQESAPVAQENAPKAEDSDQFKNYADYINAGNTLATGDREQIAMDERLNDGEAERLLAMADKAASAQENAPKAEADKPKPFNEYGHYKGQSVYVIDNFGNHKFDGVVAGKAQNGGVLVDEPGKLGSRLIDNPMRVIEKKEAAEPAAPVKQPSTTELSGNSGELDGGRSFTDRVLATRFNGVPAEIGPDGRAWRIKAENGAYIALRMPDKPGATPTYFRPAKGEAPWSMEEAAQRAANGGAPASPTAAEAPAPAPATDQIPDTGKKAAKPKRDAKRRAEKKGKAEPAQPKRGEVGMMLSSGEIVTTTTGRETTPFPKVDATSERKATATIKRVEQWLMDNAIAEAKARGDDFNLRGFEANRDKPSQADKDSAEMYLFDPAMNQPVPKPFLKPLGAGAQAEAPTGPAPEWAEKHAEAVGGDVVWHDGEIALIRGYSILNGRPVYSGAQGTSRTRQDVATYSGELFTNRQLDTLRAARAQAIAKDEAAHAANPEGPFKTAETKFAASPNVPANLAAYAKGLIDMLGIEGRVYVTTIDDARNGEKFTGPYAAINSAGLKETENGSARKLSNGDFYIAVRMHPRRTRNLEIIAHEIGHILERQVWEKVDPATRDAIMKEFRAWLETAKKGTKKELVQSLRAHTAGKTTPLTNPDIPATKLSPYWTSFSEWFADNVSRWAVSSEKPLTLVDQFFDRIGKALRRLYASISGRKYLPASEMARWLDARGPSMIVPVAAPEAISKPARSSNTTFTDEEFEQARARFLARRGAKANSMSGDESGPDEEMDPDDLIDGIKMAGWVVEKGDGSFASYASTLLEMVGEPVRPYLQSWYLALKFDPKGRRFASKMTGAAEVEAFDFASLNKPTAKPVEQETVSNEPEKLDQPGAGTLERVPADKVQIPATERETRGSAETGGRADVSGTGQTGRKRNGPAGSVGDSQGTLSLPAGRAGAEGVEPASGKRASDVPADFAISEDDKIGEGGKKTKYKQNIEAIRIVKRLAETGEKPSAADQKALAKYVGWGGIPEAFERSDGSVSKGWEKEANELKELLTPEEYAEAAESTQYAHYTAPEIVAAMWDGMRRMGFIGGRVLEPGMGVGNFFGLMPKDLRAASALHGVEKDIITGGVAKGLYPAAKIAAPMDFRDYSIPEGYFDAAIGNPPFASTKIRDNVNRDISGFSLHNYFFAKALNGLKPGGVMSMVVTSRMLDSISDTSRQYMADRADLVAAIRLPNNAFLKNAGTEVTTDIIILRKRKEGEAPSAETWAKVGEYTNEKGETVPLNEYFIRHPENMLGEFGPYGSMYNPDEPALVARKGQDTPALLREAIARLPENITSGSAIEIKEETPIPATAVEHVRVGSAFMHDGKVMVRDQDRLGEPQATEATFANEKAKERVIGMIGVRDAFAALRALQLDPSATDKQIAEGRKTLNDVYDKFVKKNGYINEDANKRIFRDDPSWPQIAALEDNFSKGVSAAVAKTTGQAPAKPSAKKSAIFTKRTQSPYAPPTKAATAKDALLAALSERGRVDLDLMQKLYGKDKETILKELGNLVFDDPIKGPVTREEYLSGNVKAKLAQAINAAEKDPALKRNVDALKAVQPPDVDAVDIRVKIGSHWVPVGIMREFTARLMGGENNLNVVYNPATANWTIDGRATPDAETQWGTSRKYAADIIEAAANQRSIVVRDRQSDNSSVVNDVETQAANDKVQAVKNEWNRWVFEDDDRREKLSKLYNEMFNTDVGRDFDGSHLTFPGKVGDDVVQLRPHQGNAVWRILQSATTLLDHVVGAGKTFTMVAAAMEMRRMGLAKKPMFVVPNHLVGQWAADFVKLYPNAQILAATKKDFEKENRKKLFARIATGDWDAVIVGHSSLIKVEVDPKSQSAFIEKQVMDLLLTEEAIRVAEGKKSRNVKKIQDRIAKLREKQRRLLETGAKDDSLYWKELGVDALFVDEAHEFKNLEFSTSMQRVAGLGAQSGSQKASDLYLKIDQVLEATGGRNVVFATGTPISNTMAEMFTVQRYLDGKAIKEQGLSHFDAWARLFGDVVTDWELSATGTYKLNNRFAKFVNMPELMQRYTSFADVINRDDINAQLAARGQTLPVPKIKGGKPQNIVVDRSEYQAKYIGEPKTNADGNEYYEQGTLIWRAENMPKKPEKGADNMLKIMSDARKAALDMRLIDPAYPDYPGSKVNNAADRIVDIYKKWDADKGTQLVFIDLSTPKGAQAKEQAALRELIAKAEEGDEEAQEKLDSMSPDEFMALDAKFSVYDDLKQKLIDRGIPENEIAFIHDVGDDKSGAKKEELFGKVRSGRVRVLFGSTPKMGAGMNVQERLVALHHLDAPWRPSDLEQREGRIIRQGNILRDRDPDNFEVEINRYAAKNTLDSRMWQTIEGKARFIEQVRKGTQGSREIEDIAGEAANAAEMKAAASGNPLILEEMTLRQRVKRLENEEEAHKSNQWSLSSKIRWEKSYLERLQDSFEKLKKDMKREIPKEFLVTIRGEKFDKRIDAGDKIIEEMKNMDVGTKQIIGSYGDFQIEISSYGGEGRIILKGSGEYESSAIVFEGADAQGVGQRIVTVGKETRSLGDYESKISEQKKTVEKMEAQRATWNKQNELDEARAKHRDILAQLKPKGKNSQTGKKLEDQNNNPLPPHGGKAWNALGKLNFKTSIGQSAGMTADALRDTLTRGKDGSFVKALIDAGRVVLHDTAKTAPGFSTQRGPVQAAVTPDGTMHFVASNLDASTARGVLLHEAFHAGGETLLGSAGFRALLRRVQTAADSARPGSWAAEAKARAEAAGTSPAHMAEEIAAYAIEDAENAPAGIREIADRIVGAVKAFILRKFGKQFGAVTPGQLRALAASALRAGAPVGETRTQDGVRFSIASTAGANKPKGKTAFERATNAASDFLTQAMVGGGARPGQFSSLALAPVRALFTELAEGMPSARGYLDTKQAMDAFRNEMNTADDALLQDWLKWGRKNKDANSRLMDVMHDSTLEQYDPTLTDAEAAAKGQTVVRDIKDAYNALPKEAKEFYAKIRDTYAQRAKDVEDQVVANVKKALTMILRNAQRAYDAEIERIRDEGLTGKDKLDAEKAAREKLTLAQTRLARNKAARIKRMRQYFESNRLKGPYFPLARFGNYFITLRDEDGKVLSFEKYGNRFAQRARAEELRGLYGKDAVQESTAQYDTKETRNVDPGFLASVDTILDEAGVDMGVRDAIYQTYLETMPDLSMRKASLHRKGTPGFDKDAVRGFAHNMFHSAHQLSRLRYGMDLQDHLAETAKQARNSADPIRAQAVYNEMVKSHEFTMNPDGSPIAHRVTSAVFLWTMAFNLSTAMVNTLQSVNVGIPNIAFDVETAGNAGIRKATRAMVDAGIDFVRGKGSVLNSGKLSADERAAVTAAYNSGLIDSTQAHDLAGVAESGISYRPGVQRFMRAASLPMHHTERFNREVTFLAAYRVSRDAGLDHVAAIKKASDQTWATHFDNQSNAKPRFARGQLGKMLFALKSYQANFVYRIFRDLHQALEGQTQTERRTALKRFASMFALTSAAAGIRGAFFYSTIMAIAGAFMGLAGNDDDDPDEIVRKFVIEHIPDAMIGHAVSGMILDGVPGYLTGTSLTNRVGMQDMWFHTTDRDLNATQQWMEWTTQLLGAGAGIGFQLWKGIDDISKGNTARGVEKMLPAALRNVAKAVRYLNEGVQDKYGNPIVDNVPLQDALKQAIGFTPAEIADRFARNTYQNNRQDRIEAKATEARKAVARAMLAGDAAAEAEGRKAVDKFNAKYPEYQIQPKSIMQSMRNMENRKDRMEFGVDLNKKLADRIKAGTAPSIYAR